MPNHKWNKRYCKWQLNPLLHKAPQRLCWLYPQISLTMSLLIWEAMNHEVQTGLRWVNYSKQRYQKLIFSTPRNQASYVKQQIQNEVYYTFSIDQVISNVEEAFANFSVCSVSSSPYGISAGRDLLTWRTFVRSWDGGEVLLLSIRSRILRGGNGVKTMDHILLCFQPQDWLHIYKHKPNPLFSYLPSSFLLTSWNVCKIQTRGLTISKFSQKNSLLSSIMSGLSKDIWLVSVRNRILEASLTFLIALGCEWR